MHQPCHILLAVLAVAVAAAQTPPSSPLAGTAPLTWSEEDLSGRMMDGAHVFVERKIAESPAGRARFWARDFSSVDAYTKSVQPNRERLKVILGVVDPRLPPGMERYGDDAHPALVAETPHYRVYQVRWPVLDGVSGRGLLVQPTKPAVAHVVLMPDAGQWPEQLLGLEPGLPPAGQVARRLAENGFELVIPLTISREKIVSTDSRMTRSDQTHREWIYRQAFHMGRHVIGYEVQTALAAVDWLRAQRKAPAKIGVAGVAEGGLAAFYAAATAAPAMDGALVSGYFESRQIAWSQPIYRNVWSLLREFGDAEIASLIAPAALVIEHSAVPDVTGHKGELRPPEFSTVRAEWDRIEVGSLFAKPTLVHDDTRAVASYSEAALAAFARGLGVARLAPLSSAVPARLGAKADYAARHADYFRELEGHVQLLVRRSEHVRDRSFLFSVMPELTDSTWSTAKRHPTHAPEKFIAGAKAHRERFHEEGMGRFEEPLLPFNARTRQIAETGKWTAYDVVLDVWPEVFAWGVLVVPKDVQPGERRPVVVCQHGRNGLPRQAVDGNTTAMSNFAAQLAERGFVTFAPHNLYRGEDRYRYLSRKANTVKASLFSFIIAQHDQILRWLATQPFVDAKRIAFYGLSYGGETAVRVPPILEQYCLSICSGDFNQWTEKVAATDQPFSFMRTIEWEMPYWNLGHTFDYAEMAYLMFPRPFMVERGHLDQVGRNQWVAHEYAKVHWLYAQLGRPERTAIEYFQGGHSINGEGTFEFLHRHLAWPRPRTLSP